MTRTTRDWAAIVADLKEHEGRWRLHPSLAAAPQRVAKTARLRQVQVLHELDGTLEVAALNQWVDENGQWLADVYLKWSAP